MSAEMWGGATPEYEHEAERVLAGEPEALRPRLAAALERLGYKVLAEQPSLVARRKARGGAASGCSSNVLDYSTELIVALKPLGEAATRVSFGYTVKNFYTGTRADLAVLGREADALAALAVSQLSAEACASCGIEATDDSRFCRRCGAPLASPEPAEIELLRVAAGTRAAYKNILPSAIILPCVIALAFFLVVQGSEKTLKGALFLLGFGGVSGAFTLLWGVWMLSRTLGARPEEAKAGIGGGAVGTTPRFVTAPRVTAALPPRTPCSSVTESTTELLEALLRREPLMAARTRRAGDSSEE